MDALVLGMEVITNFNPAHEDLVHDISYDFYGKRLATCSTDQKIKVWNSNVVGENSSWQLDDSWKVRSLFGKR